MFKRIITAAVALAVFIVVLLLPQTVFTVALAAVIIMMLYECYSATKADLAMRIAGFISAALIMANIYGTVVLSMPLTSAIPAVVLLIYMWLIIIKHGKRDYKDILSSGFLTMYITVCTGCIWITKSVFGTSLMLLIFISAWSCDTFAYFTGRFFGRHKLIPHVSPNKTVEGSIGGVAGAVICCIAYLFILRALSLSAITNNMMTIITGASCGLAGGIFSQFGDLTASAVKRDTGIKDFGWIFPGHGGFMDRFDSVIFISPLILSILTVFIK